MRFPGCVAREGRGKEEVEGGRGLTRLAPDGKLGRILLECLYGGLTRVLDVLLDPSVD